MAFGDSFAVLDVGFKSLAKSMGASERDIYYMESVLSGIPGVGAFYSARDKMRYMDDYMANRGISYSSVKYPSMTVGYQGVSGLASFVSSNIERLYR